MTDIVQISPEAQERLERAKSRSVMILTPIARNPVWQFTASLASTIMTLNQHGIRCAFNFVVGSSVVHRARNELLAFFLAAEGFTDAIFIDDDMEWTPNDVLRLLGSDKPVIGGVGRMRVQAPNTDPNVWCWRPIHDEKGVLKTDDMGAVEVAGVGGAFLLINKGILVDMLEAHPEWKVSSPEDWPDAIKPFHYEVFRPEQKGDMFTSEDFVFCNRVREFGGSVWVDPSITLGHVGSYNYRGSVQEVLS